MNCHGGVNPFIDGVGDPSEPTASRFEHGGGKMDAETDCASCHATLAPKRDGSPSRWRVPEPSMFFVGKDTTTLCDQMRGEFAEPQEFIEHLEDDRGGNNFVGTAFMGNRGLSAEQYPEIPPQRPSISASALVDLGKDWATATDGKFKGDRECGCKPLHYAIRVTTVTEVKSGLLQMQSAMEPVELPITFQDDGSFTAEAVVNFKGQAAVSSCDAQYRSNLNIRASGEIFEEEEDSGMRLQLENTAPSVDSVSAQCPRATLERPNVESPSTPSLVIKFDMAGLVGEFGVYQMRAGGGLSSQLRAEIVQLADAPQ